jgi:Flp pilus assembly protein TadG
MKSRNRQAQARSRKGQALIETAVASIFIVPVVLGLLDVSVMVMANQINDSVAKNAARAAANQPDQMSAQKAAQNVFDHVAHSPIITNVSLNPGGFNYSGSKDGVSVQSRMDVNLPVAIAGWQHQVFIAQSVQPIVSE